MPFKKGTSGNPAGRPGKLTPNQGYKIREAFELLVEENLAQLRHDIAAMPPKERLSFLARFAEYVVPKLSRCKLPKETDTFEPMLRNWVITSVKPSHEKQELHPGQGYEN